MKLVIAMMLLAYSIFPQTVFANGQEAESPEAVLMKDFSENKYWPAGKDVGRSKHIEFCGGDWCQEVLIEESSSLNAAWEALFLMFYFFDANEEYVAKRETLVLNLLNDYRDQCPRSDRNELKASCVLSSLQKMHRLQYRRVQYDIGYRCSSIFSAAPPHFTGEGDCAEMQIGE